MDTTTIGIALGVSLSALYAGFRAINKQPFDLNHTVLVFLSAFSVPGGVALIAAGFVGSAENLPSSWREHVTVAGIVAIGIAVRYVCSVFYEIWQMRARPAESGSPSEGQE
ncbi:hypothetical protein HBO12_27265 [Pseudomonas sp. WS 5059]|uniref:hypothetical protein n=1 Tax=Pseudomonas sp. WS 5059 TaxID=2717491 RepID=UPI001475198B|nr:hypothetical protein [Pseudomonas sp. WS 5059]NMY06661.1 hypothetical protein [Pseudomonas sp. WS 5059]